MQQVMCAKDVVPMIRSVISANLVVPMTRQVMCGAQTIPMAISVAAIGLFKTRFNQVSR
jgi:hypothetical protein